MGEWCQVLEIQETSLYKCDNSNQGSDAIEKATRGLNADDVIRNFHVLAHLSHQAVIAIIPIHDEMEAYAHCLRSLSEW